MAAENAPVPRPPLIHIRKTDTVLALQSPSDLISALDLNAEPVAPTETAPSDDQQRTDSWQVLVW